MQFNINFLLLLLSCNVNQMKNDSLTKQYLTNFDKLSI